MRALTACATLAMLLLAGCATEEPDAEPPQLWGACPQWISGDALPTQALAVDGDADATFTAPLDHQGRPLDRYALQITATGDVDVRFYDEAGGRLGVTTFDPVAQQPFLALGDEQVEVAVFLTPVEHGSDPVPGPLRLEASGDGTLNVTATPWYRVCGT